MPDKEWEDFCEWCGFRMEDRAIKRGTQTVLTRWTYPNGRHGFLPKKDMNFLIKYAVPKAIEILKAQVLDGEAIWARCELMRRWLREWNDKPEDPVEALYQVLNQARKEKE